MRPQEYLAVNVCDFSCDFTMLTFREAKTNKLRINEPIPLLVAQKIRLYVQLNSFRLKEGFLFPFYSKKVNGLPFMSSKVFDSWFSKIRHEIAKKYPKFNDRYPFACANNTTQMRYRINVYSLGRRFFETYLFINNNFNLALVKEIMEYSSKFDPMKHYIKFFHEEESKSECINNTFNSLISSLISGQKSLSEFKV